MKNDKTHSTGSETVATETNEKTTQQGDGGAAKPDFQRATRAAIKVYNITESILEAALAYASHGVPVFPLDPKTKSPIAAKLKDEEGNSIAGTGGFYRATTDPDQIREWWCIKNWPGYCRNYLIGVPMGLLLGLWVLDVDTEVEHDHDGVAAWKALQEQHGIVKVRREHRTSSGGLHLFFDWTEANPIGLSTGSLPAGMEVKAKGGYIAVPPSRRNDKAYVVSRDGKPGPAPQWLYDLIGVPPEKSGASRSSRPGTTPWDDHNSIVDPDLLADAMKWIPNAEPLVKGWVEWANWGLAIYRATGGSERGFKIFDDWSQTNKRYFNKKVTPRERWEEMRGSPPNRTGASKIWNEAIKNGWKAKATYAAPKFDGLAAARERLEQIFRRFLGIGLNIYQAFGRACHEITEAVRVTTGVGKTTIAAKVIAWLIKQTGSRIGLAVPTHKLGREIAKQFTDLGIDARVFYGRNADDPESPGDKMCLEPEKVEVATHTLQNITKSCCKYKSNECQFYSQQASRQCGYWRQQNGKKPQVWIFPRDLLFHDQQALGYFDFLFIDESLWGKQLRGIDTSWELPIAQRPNDGPRNDLRWMLSLQTEDGGLRREILDLGSTDAREQTEEIRKEWRRMPELGMRPNMSKHQYHALDAAVIEEIALARKIILVREELRRMLLDPDIKVSGRLVLKWSSKLQQRVLTWRGVAPIAERFETNTMLMDATLPSLNILQVSHPKVKIVADIEVAMPDSVRIRQVLGAPTSSEKLGANSTKLDKKKSQTKHLEEMRRYILQRYFETGRGKTLVIAQQQVDAWLLRKNLPAEISVAHYKAIAGLDKHKDVRLLIMLGRTAPGPQAIEALAATLSGQMPPSIIDPDPNVFSWYPQVRRSIRIKGSRLGRAVMGDQHPDPICEEIRWQTNEGEVMQALGRARGVNRDKDSPLDIDLVLDTVLPIEVDEVANWETPSLYIATAAEGVMLETPVDMVKIWPKLWANEKAADRTIKEGLPKLPGFSPIIYQPTGAKKKRRTGHFDLSVIPDPEAWLESRLGPLRILAG
jgi:hypothetical protein